MNRTFNKPDFICIGPPKTGTQWLYHILQKHPEVILPDYKEIRYFWEKEVFGDVSFLYRYRTNHWHFRTQRIFSVSQLKKHTKTFFKEGKINWSLIKWNLDFLLKRRNDEWYVSLFDSSKISGDFSPIYHRLTDESIRKIRTNFPNTKILILLRNPVDRVWSAAKMVLCKNRGRDLKNVSKEEFYRYFDQEISNDYSHYHTLIQKWQHAFPEEQIHINFYDKLKEAPHNFVDDVGNFLGLSEKPSEALKGYLNEQRNVGIKEEISNEFYKYLAQHYYNSIERLNEVCPDQPYVNLWLKEFDKMLNDSIVK